MTDVEKLLKRFGKAKANKMKWESHLKECYDYVMPQRNTMEQREKGQKIREKIYDSTAEESLEDYATRMESELVPPNMNWLKLEAGTDIPEDEADNANNFLEETTKTLFNHINSSNFSSQIHESFLDLGVSTGALIVEPGDGIQSALNYRCVSLSELYLESSSSGTIKNVFRVITIPVSEVTDTWKSAKLSDNLKNMEERDPTIEVTFIEGVIENAKGGFDSFVIYEKDKYLLVDEKIESSPFVIFRESTIPGEVYGRGRVMRALADIKTLNVMVRDFLNGLRWYTSPTFTASDDGVINPYNFRLKPGTVNPVGSNTRDNPTLQALQVGGQPILLTEAIRMLQDSIRKILLSKPFGNIEETPVRTATEMSIRNADLAKTALGAGGRIQNELLESIVSRSVYVLKQAGKVADFKVDGREVAIKFTSPSSRTQDEHTLAAIGRAIEMFSVLDPGLVTEEIKLEDIPTLVWDTLGLPATLKRTDAEKMQRQQQAQQQQQADREIAAAQTQGGQ